MKWRRVALAAMSARFGRRTSVDDVGERHLDAGVINQALSRFVFHVLLCDEQRIGDALFLPFHHARLQEKNTIAMTRNSNNVQGDFSPQIREGSLKVM